MESVRTAVIERVEAKYGSLCLEIESRVPEPYYKLCILDKKYRDYVLYFWPNDSETECMCYYALREDLLACTKVSAELQDRLQSKVYQLVRRYNTKRKQLVAKICDYVDDAVANIDLKRDVSCRGSYVRIKTFEEAKTEALMYPEPTTKVVILPPPKCKRHIKQHWEAERKKPTPPPPAHPQSASRTGDAGQKS